MRYTQDQIKLLFESLDRDLAEQVTFAACSMNPETFLRKFEDALLISNLRILKEDRKKNGKPDPFIEDYQDFFLATSELLNKIAAAGKK